MCDSDAAVGGQMSGNFCRFAAAFSQTRKPRRREAEQLTTQLCWPKRVRGGVEAEHSCFCPQCPPPPGRLEESDGLILLLNGMLFTNYVHKIHYLCYSQKLFGTENMLWKIRLWEGRKMRWWNPTILIIMQSNHSVKLIKDVEGFYASQNQMGGKKHDLMTFVRKWWGCSHYAV